MDRYKHANESTPEIIYVDRGCCHKYGTSAVGNLFDKWVLDAKKASLNNLTIKKWLHVLLLYSNIN